MNRFNRALLAMSLACGFAVPAFAQQTATQADADVQEMTQEAEPEVEPVSQEEIDAALAAKAKSSRPAANPAPADPSLLPAYKDFGELPGITALIDDFMVRLLADARMKPFFENVDQAKVKKHLVEQFCVILGGPCTYTGRDMVEAHEGLEINRNNFNALVEVLQVSMDKRGIPFRSQNRLLAKLAPMHREIETR